MSEEKRKQPSPVVAIVLIIVLICGVVFAIRQYQAYISINSRIDAILNDNNSSFNSNPSSNIPKSYSLQYRITSGSETADITYENSSGDTSQEGDAKLPWTESFPIKEGEFFYVSAQSNSNGSVRITCDVLLNGKVVKHSESNGKYVIVTCSGSAGED